MSKKNCNDTIGNRTRDLHTSSAVPQPTAPPRAPTLIVAVNIINESLPAFALFILHDQIYSLKRFLNNLVSVISRFPRVLIKIVAFL